MRKLWVYICSIFLLVGAYSPPIITNAFDQEIYDKAKAEGNDKPANPLAWRQARGDVACPTAIGTTPAKGLTQIYGADATYGAVGCTYFATCYFLIRVGIWSPKDDGTIMDWINKIVTENNWSGYAPLGKELTGIYPKVECVAEGQVVGTYEQMKVKAKEAFDRGNFLVLCANCDFAGHAIYVDYIDENGDIVIIDSSMPQIRFTDPSGWWSTCRAGGSFGYASYEYHVEGVTPQNTKTLHERYGDGKDIDFKKDSDKTEKTKEEITTELDMLGYTPFSSIAEQHTVVDMNNVVTLQEKLNMENLKQDIKATKETNMHRFIGIMKGIIGIGVCIYSMLLIIAYMFDTNNPFFDVSLLSLLTFGKWHVTSSDVGDRYFEGQYTVVSLKKIMIFSGLMFALGIMILTGQIQAIMIGFVDKIRSFLG